jgi:TPR repeat protein
MTRKSLLVAAALGVLCPACGQSPDRPAPETPADVARTVDVDAPNGVCPAGAQKVEHVGCVDEGLAFSIDALDTCRAAGEGECSERCQQGDAPSCTALGLVHAFALEASPNTTYAARLLDKACAVGDGMACNDLGVLHAKGIGFPVEIEKAEALYAAGCDRGSIAACANLSMARVWGSDPPENVTRAVSLVKRACEAAADGRSCAALGWMTERGSATARDEKAAAAYYARGCELGDQSACARLGKAYFGGAGVAPDDALAMRYLRQACDSGRSDACTDLAMMYCLGRGIPRDPARSTALVKQACDAGDGAACRAGACKGF